jgi:non-heme Fe2+,alpha-ketoglutarate-dependent halogenase
MAQTAEVRAAARPVLPREVSKAAFDRDGYVCPVPVLSEAETRHYRAQFDAYYARHAERLAALKPSQRWQINSDTHFAFQWVDELTRHPNILDAVQQVLGPNILAWNSSWFVKLPGDQSFIGWHQDGAYWGLEPMELLTAWIALGPATPENGNMRVIPGSHQHTHLPQRDTFAENSALTRGQEISVAVDEQLAVDLTLAPGQMSMHHLWIVHGSNANRTEIPRIGLAVRYISTRVRQHGVDDPFAMLVRGEDTHHHFRLTARPTRNDGMAGEGLHGEALRRVQAGIAKAKPASG